MLHNKGRGNGMQQYRPGEEGGMKVRKKVNDLQLVQGAGTCKAF